MEEQVSWKGQGFTLLVFGGIVFLCSIFFVLGMLVGRGQGQRSAETSVAATAAKVAAAEARSQAESEKTELTAYKDPAPEKPAELKPAPAVDPPKSSPPPVTAPAKPAAKATPTPVSAATPAPAKMIYWQVGALKEKSAAKKQVDLLQKQGFLALIVTGEGANKLLRIHVGPFSNAADAEVARRKLESLGYMPIKK
jgi:cell division protein FtsN